MLLATNLPTTEERNEALACVPELEEIEQLLKTSMGTFRRGALDLIDAASGVGNHLRAAVVATHEAIDGLFRASLDLAESVAVERYFAREKALDPRTGEPLMPPDAQDRYPAWAAKHLVDGAAVRVASAGDHLATAHIRLAWEANAALPEDVLACKFDPALPEPVSWSSAKDLREGLRAARRARRRERLGVFDAFELNEPFRRFYSTREVREARRFRDQFVHRDRPSYREAPAFGRTTIWTAGRISLTFPPREDADEQLPSLADRRDLLRAAIGATFTYAQSTWDVGLRLLQPLGISVTRRDDEVTVQVGLGPIAGQARVARENRDPGPFLRT